MIEWESTESSGDRLLWILAAAVTMLAIVSLLLINFWPSAGRKPASTDGAEIVAAVETRDSEAGGETSTASESSDAELISLLTRARLALDAGLLVEPEEISAWSLYREALALAPDNRDALDGLSAVADRLVAAASPGNLDETAKKILSVLPEHGGALALAAGETPHAAAGARAEAPPAENERPSEAEHPLVDPIPDLFASFEAALAVGRLTEPANDCARDYFRYMRALNPAHQLTLSAKQTLFEALLRRHEEDFDSLRLNAAAAWLEEAEALDVDAARIAAARAELSEFVRSLDATVPLPASDFRLIEYTAPDYPEPALRDRIEGWVDVSFTIGRDGHTRDISVTRASHETLFTNEAAYAVALWRFAPQTIMGRLVDQRAFDRISFSLED